MQAHTTLIRRTTAFLGALALGAAAVLAAPDTPARAADPAFQVLVFSKTAGYRHDSIPAGIAALRSLGTANNFTVTATEDSAAFTPAISPDTRR